MVKKCGSYEIHSELGQIVLRIDFERCPYPAFVSERLAMSKVIEILSGLTEEKDGFEAKDADKIIIVKQVEHVYDKGQTSLLIEIAEAYRDILTSKPTDLMRTPECAALLEGKRLELIDTLIPEIKKNPINAYREIAKRESEAKNFIQQSGVTKTTVLCYQKYITVLKTIKEKLLKSRLIQTVATGISEVKEKDIYEEEFKPSTLEHVFEERMASYPEEGTLITSYTIPEENADVVIFKIPGTMQTLYHITPPELKLTGGKDLVWHTAKEKLLAAGPGLEVEYRPEEYEITREEAYLKAVKLIEETAGELKIKILNHEKEELARILVRHTKGFGILEVLLKDQNVEDINVNSPVGKTPMFIVHRMFEGCLTNIIPLPEETREWVSKLEYMSGREFSAASPILDAELRVPVEDIRARVAVLGHPLNPYPEPDIAMSLRNQKAVPFTFPFLVWNKTMSPITAGLLSFLIEGNRTMLFAGTRGSGKTSLLGSVLTELTRDKRIITIEDTLELPVESMIEMSYNIQQLRVASAFTRGTTEIGAEEGIRTTLRMGDSSLIVGEIRSKEAIALYEAMRVGAQANIVAGTIHGESPYGVYDRVVNDLGVPKTSFKATDIIVMSAKTTKAIGVKNRRRIWSVTEVRKYWEEDPLREKAFVDLLVYDPKQDTIVLSPDLEAGNSEIIKDVSARLPALIGNWDAVIADIQLRAKSKEAIANLQDAYNEKRGITKKDAEKIVGIKGKELLDMRFVLQANEQFRNIYDEIMKEVGLDDKRIFEEWNTWLQRTAKNYMK